MLNRREFSGILAAAAGARLSAQTGARKRVLIAGAGIAGLCCAHELTRRGFDVTIFEGRSRPGGRIETLREGLAPGLTAECGATRIPDTHDLTLAYVREFGLSLEPFHLPPAEDVFHLRGRSFTEPNGKEPDWPLNLTAEERKLGRAGLTRRYLLPPVIAAKPHARMRGVPPPIAAVDRASLGEYLSAQGLSRDAIELVTLGFSPTVSTGQMMLIEASSEALRGYFHIRGGNDQLPYAMARGLAGRIHYGCRIVAFEQDGNEASVTIERGAPGGARETHRASHVICTLPFSVTGGLFSGAHLPPAKRRLTSGAAGYHAMSKVFLQMREQFWRQRGQSGFAFTDLLSERFWSLGSAVANQRGLLLSYAIGPNAEQLDSMPEEDRIAATLRDAERVFPGARANCEGARTKSWALDPWQNGGTLRTAPGELGLMAQCGQREGRIHFAGEHTSRWSGWMQGSLESARRVVGEIADA